MTAKPKIAVLGVFVADLAFRAARLPNMGETLMGSNFAIGPGGKGSNQAVAAARAGGDTSFIAKIADDTFGSMARRIWAESGVTDATTLSEVATGAAMIFVDEQSGDNAIIIVPGAGGLLSAQDVDSLAAVIRSADVFLTQLEQPMPTALRALEIAKDAGVTTVLNPAPATGPLDSAFYPLCDYVTPNESEAESLTGISVAKEQEAHNAAEKLLASGAGNVLLTMGERGAYLHDGATAAMTPAFSAGDVVETTGAGDSFNGAFAVALGEGRKGDQAVRFANAAAAISVTRPGTAPSMPMREEIDALLGGQD